MRDRALKQGHRAAAEQPREKKVLINIFSHYIGKASTENSL